MEVEEPAKAAGRPSEKEFISTLCGMLAADLKLPLSDLNSCKRVTNKWVEENHQVLEVCAGGGYLFRLGLGVYWSFRVSRACG